MAEKITTGINALPDLVKKKGKIKLSVAAKLLDTDKKSLEELAKILEEQDIIKLEYTFTGDKILTAGKNINMSLEEEQEKTKKAVFSGERDEELNKVLGVIKKRIATKKRKGAIKGKAEIKDKRAEEKKAEEKRKGEAEDKRAEEKRAEEKRKGEAEDKRAEE
ncbi:MAG: hypothetical protein B6U72_07440, partial [Candidatus Altiarchaeales archaeon ex4484_2]